VVSRVAVVAPVYRNAATLPALAARLRTTLGDRPWRLRLVIDASPDDSLAVAESLAAADPRIAVTHLTVNGGQHAALARGLADEPDADAWVCLDADLQDPPEAVPLLLARLAVDGTGAVFAGRRGAYESPGRRLTGTLHRWLAARLTGLPPDAGAFFAMDARVRAAVLTAMAEEAAPSVVLGVVRAGVPVASVPVAREQRPSGRSAWTGRARLRQSARSLIWALHARR
jgi:polyisoprenyl-phosphate glycosyltransferase